MNLLEGRQYYDAFVYGAKAAGIYVEVCTASGKGTIVADPVIAIASHSATITAVAGVTFKYTLDGTDPRYSNTAVAYSGAVTTTAGQTIKAFGEKTGSYPSIVKSATDA